MSRVIPLVLALLWLASSQASVPPPPITGTQVSTGYGNVASGQLLKASEQVSTALSQAGFIPTESFAGATVGLEGQSVHASGRVRGTICNFSFRNGALNGIYRADLFEDKGPASLILHHLTNEVLTLTTTEAPARALKFLRCLSYDVDAIQRAYRIAARDDLMDAYPIRNGGTNFPKDLHFFGELISRKKIRIYVEFAPQDPASLTNHWEPANMQLEFLATTGELLEARMPDPGPLMTLGIRTPGRLPLVEAPDFTPPVFISASRKVAVPALRVSSNDAVVLLRQVWGELQPKLASNPVQCYLLCDNLNQPEAIAREFSTLAQATPWAGASHFWPDDVPFARATMNTLSQDRRGVAILAICGKVQTQLEAIRDLGDVAAPRNGHMESQALFAKDRERLLPLVTNLLNRISPPASMPDTVLFMIQASPNLASRVVSGEIESRTRSWAQAFEASGVRPYNTIGEGITYYNGAVLSNTLVVLRLSGSLPLRMDPTSLLRRLPERRLIGGEVSRPVTDLAYSFGPHPMQELFGILGRDLIALLQQADHVEPFRIKPNMYGEQSVPGRPNIEGHEIITEGKPLGPDFASQVAAAILNNKNVLGVGANCDFMPRDAFRISHGNEFAILLISFECREIHIKYFDATGKPTREAGFYMGANADAMARLVKEATGTSTVPAHASLPSDFFEPASVDGLAINSDASSIVLTWPSRPPESFAVLWRSNATTETLWLTLTNQLPASPYAATTSFRHALDPSPYRSSSLTNFYRVVVVPDFWFDLKGVLLSGGPKSPGEDFIPIYYGTTETGIFRPQVQLVVDGESDAAYSGDDDIELVNFGTPDKPRWLYATGFWFSHDRFKNGAHTLQLRTTLTLNSYVGDLSQYLNLTNRPVRVVTTNDITFAGYTETVESACTIVAQSAQPRVNWRIDIRNSKGHLLASKTGRTLNGDIRWTWNLRDTKGKLHDDLATDPYFAPETTIWPLDGDDKGARRLLDLSRDQDRFRWWFSRLGRDFVHKQPSYEEHMRNVTSSADNPLQNKVRARPLDPGSPR